MELRELLEALRCEVEAAGGAIDAASATLAFAAHKERDGTVRCDFVDAASMSTPRTEQIHRLQVTLGAVPQSPMPEVSHEPSGKPADQDPLASRLHIPPALPPKRSL